jgi:ectoine hydroxylase-related dioxygenase (phytanoyl-CoA dioxygenase family)
MGLRLTEEQKEFYETNGYLIHLPPVFDTEGVQALIAGFDRLKAMLMEDEDPSDIMNWHRKCRWLYDIASHPQILDYVEDILGPNFYMWNTEFITKPPHSGKVVAWHQDAYHWPLRPHNTVTVWLAFADVDEANGAMRVIPGSHKGGIMKHVVAEEASINSFGLDTGTYREDSNVPLIIPAGGMSLHDDAIIHGSRENTSDRWRIAYIIRYSSEEVKCDLAQFPDFKAYWMRGIDHYGHNPQGQSPTVEFDRPDYFKRKKRTVAHDHQTYNY